MKKQFEKFACDFSEDGISRAFLKFNIRIDLLMGFIRKYPSIILLSPDHTSAAKFRDVSAAQITPSYTILWGSNEIIKVNSTPEQAMKTHWGSCIALLFL